MTQDDFHSALLERLDSILDALKPCNRQTDGAQKPASVVPFGKNKGVPWSDLNDRALSWYAFDWTPKPYGSNPLPSPQDLAAKEAAVSEAKRRGITGADYAPISSKQTPEQVKKPASAPVAVQDEVPF